MENLYAISESQIKSIFDLLDKTIYADAYPVGEMLKRLPRIQIQQNEPLPPIEDDRPEDN